MKQKKDGFICSCYLSLSFLLRMMPWVLFNDNAEIIIKEKIMRDSKGRFVKGFRASKATEFKKGQFSGEKHPRWNGGKSLFKNGYYYVYAPWHPKACKNRIQEHIIVAEKSIGRFLKDGEEVHHINGIKTDNTPENLMVVTHNEHMKLHIGRRKFDVNMANQLLKTLNPQMVAKELGVHFTTIYKHIKKGELSYEYTRKKRID